MGLGFTFATYYRHWQGAGNHYQDCFSNDLKPNRLKHVKTLDETHEGYLRGRCLQKGLPASPNPTEQQDMTPYLKGTTV